MISFDEAKKIVNSKALKTGSEKVTLDQSAGRVLAMNIKADMDMPPFSRSAMDGYACRQEDLGKPLKIIEEIPAGKNPQKKIMAGQCAKIMTGAPIPEGSDWVVMVENTSINETGLIVVSENGKNPNIRQKGEYIRKGQVIIPEGTRITKQHVGIMAMAGILQPEVFNKPSVGIISTGSELVPVGRQPEISQIRNSNGPQLIAQLQDLRINATDYGIITDHRSLIKDTLEMAIEENDVVLISGGVSAGDYDYVPSILEEIGFSILMHKMKVRPGKPLLFAESGNRVVFGIPGNPVSTFVQFEMLIRPFLLKKMGSDNPENLWKMPMGIDFDHKAGPLRYFLPVKFDGNGVIPLLYHGSGHLTAYSEASGILVIPEGKGPVKMGEIVNVKPL